MGCFKWAHLKPHTKKDPFTKTWFISQKRRTLLLSLNICPEIILDKILSPWCYQSFIIIALHPFQPFSGDQMEDFSSELFSSFFDDHLAERPQLGERTSFLHMDIESSPGKLLFHIPSIWDVEVLSGVHVSYSCTSYISAAHLLVQNNVIAGDSSGAQRCRIHSWLYKSWKKTQSRITLQQNC